MLKNLEIFQQHTSELCSNKIGQQKRFQNFNSNQYCNTYWKLYYTR